MTKPTKDSASAQSDQSLRCPPKESLDPKLLIKETAKTLVRLVDLSLRLAHMPFCWFCQEVAHMSKRREIDAKCQFDIVFNKIQK